MVLYEVNIAVLAEAAKAYRQWLQGHITEMLSFKGFHSASFYEEEREDPDKRFFVVQYHVQTREDLENYFANHAAAMRAEGLRLFPEQFQAQRRILRKIIS